MQPNKLYDLKDLSNEEINLISQAINRVQFTGAKTAEVLLSINRKIEEAVKQTKTEVPATPKK